MMKKIIMLVMGFSIYATSAVKAEIRSEVINYQKAGQPFQGYLNYDDAIKGKPLVYNAEADKDSWQRMQVFLEQVFSKQ